MTTKQRGPGDGGIRKREDGRWEARVSVGYGVNAAGKPVRRRKSLYGQTRQEVADKLKAAVRDQQLGLPPANDRRTVADCLNAYLAAVQPRLKPAAYRSYEQNVRLYLIPALGRRPLAKLTPREVQAFLDAKADETTRNGRPFSASAIRTMRAVLRQALAAAEAWDLVGRNVAKLARPPRGPRRQPRSLSVAEARALLTAAEGHPLEALFRVALTLGLRQGEALGLCWRDVDLPARALRVRRAMQRVKPAEPGAKSRLQFVTPKSPTSQRPVPLPEVTVAALRAHRVRQLAAKRAAARWEERDLVFCTRHGTPLDGTNVTRYFQRLAALAGLPAMTYHDLRHSCASLLAAQGVPVEVARAILGHSDIRITLNVYTHVLDEQARRAAAAMDGLFGADRTPPPPADGRARRKAGGASRVDTGASKREDG